MERSGLLYAQTGAAEVPLRGNVCVAVKTRAAGFDDVGVEMAFVLHTAERLPGSGEGTVVGSG